MKLAAHGITREYFRNGRDTNLFTAVDKTDFELAEGSVTEIIGRSGSGKTTFINMLSGLLTPSAGTVTLDDRDLYAMDDDSRSKLRNRSIGIVPQGQTGLQSLTVIENVIAPALMYGDAIRSKADHNTVTGMESDGKTNTGTNTGVASESIIRDRALKYLEMMGIADLADVYSNELSGGELRRMSIARALINEPEIIIADEPTADLDDETTGMVLWLLRDYADRGNSVLIVTHEKEAAEYADQIYRMDRGSLQKQ